MVNEILNPLQIYNEINYNLELNAEIIEREESNGCITEKIRYNGKPIGGERISIYARFLYAAGKEDSPVLMILNDMDKTIDPKLMEYFFSMGYSVFMPDYRGVTEENKDDDNYTIYPAPLSYANYRKSGEHVYKAEPSVKETSWFEWAGVAKFSCDYLKSRKIEKIGLLGIRAGGEIAWKILQDKDIKCCITLNAAGWLAYRNYYKDAKRMSLSDERCRFIAGIDSQAYAPFVKCPVLIIGSSRDSKFELDRAYDTFLRINPDVEKSLSYSLKYNGYFGENTKKNIQLFLKKNLLGQEVFIPEPAELIVKKERDGELIALVNYDEESYVTESSVYYAESAVKPEFREWKKAAEKSKTENGEHCFSLDVCDGAKSIFVFAYCICSNGFTTVSKIIKYELDSDISNKKQRNPILYSSKNPPYGFYKINYSDYTLGNLFVVDENNIVPEIKVGANGIKGMNCSTGVISYLVGTKEFSAERNSALAFDVYAEDGCVINIVFIRYEKGVPVKYGASRHIKAKDGWQKVFFESEAFYYNKERKESTKDEIITLNSFEGVSILAIKGETKEFLVNNIIWI